MNFVLFLIASADNWFCPRKTPLLEPNFNLSCRTPGEMFLRQNRIFTKLKCFMPCPMPVLSSHCCTLFPSAGFLLSGLLKNLLPFLFQTFLPYFRGQNVKCLINIKEFIRKMRPKWFFCDEPTKHFSARPSFCVKPNWKTFNKCPTISVTEQT